MISAIVVSYCNNNMFGSLYANKLKDEEKIDNGR